MMSMAFVYVMTIAISVAAIIGVSYQTWDNYSIYDGILKTIFINFISCLVFLLWIIWAICGLIAL